MSDGIKQPPAHPTACPISWGKGGARAPFFCSPPLQSGSQTESTAPPCALGSQTLFIIEHRTSSALCPAAHSHALGRTLGTDSSSVPQELPLLPEHQSDRPQLHLLHALISPMGAGSLGAPPASSAVSTTSLSLQGAHRAALSLPTTSHSIRSFSDVCQFGQNRCWDVTLLHVFNVLISYPQPPHPSYLQPSRG